MESGQGRGQGTVGAWACCVRGVWCVLSAKACSDKAGREAISGKQDTSTLRLGRILSTEYGMWYPVVRIEGVTYLSGTPS